MNILPIITTRNLQDMHKQAEWVLRWTENVSEDRFKDYEVIARFSPERKMTTFEWRAYDCDSLGDRSGYIFVDKEDLSPLDVDNGVLLKTSAGAIGFNSNIFKELEFRYEAITRLATPVSF